MAVKVKFARSDALQIYVSPEAAVADSLDSTFADGDLERMRERVDTLRKAVAKIVAKMVASGAMSAEDLEGFLTYHYKVVVEN